jgi:hypothetical protein
MQRRKDKEAKKSEDKEANDATEPASAFFASWLCALASLRELSFFGFPFGPV